MRKRMTSLLLALALCLSLLPAAAFAAEADPAEQEQTKVVSGEQEETPAPEEPTEEEKPASGKQEQEVPDAEPAPQEAGSGTAVQAGEHTHYLCGGTDCTKIGHKEDSMVTFEPWEDATTLPRSSGAYYLTTNVTMSSDEYYPTGNVILCLNGHSITGDSAAGYPPIYVKDKGTSFTLTDCNGDKGEYHFTKTTSTSDDCFGLWVSDADGDITVTGGIITGSKSAGVFVENGTFTMYGGTICGNKNSGVSLAAYLNSQKCTFNMYGGTISGNININGGGVRLTNSANNTFIMNGGTISDNKAYTGGGVSVGIGTFTMNGGTISGNTAKDSFDKGEGGGVYVGSGTFTMSDGAVIKDNNAYVGGGVYISEGAFTMNGGSITGNMGRAGQYDEKVTGGGVYVKAEGTFTVSGAAVITGNTRKYADEKNNVHLADGSTIIVGTLDDSASIGLTPQTVPTTVAENVSADSAKRFFSDDTSKYRLVYDSEGEKLVFYSTTHADHPVCGATCNHQNDDGTKEHGNLGNWVSVDNESDLNYYLFGTDRNVYLTANITVTSGITVSGYNALCLNGYTITANGDFDIFTVKDNGARFKITDCIGGGTITRTGGTGRAVVVPTSTITITSDDYTCHFDMYAGTITGSNAASDGAVYVEDTSNFDMYGGAITGNSCTGVYVQGADAKFNLYDGTISDNSGAYGGGVHVENGAFTMSGGTITGNKAYAKSSDVGGYGGGVSLYYGSATVTGGTITGNHAEYNGGGVYVGDSSTFTVSGAPNITGNTKRADNADSNVYLERLTGGEMRIITVGEGGLSSSAQIGVTTPAIDTGKYLTVANAADGYTLTDTDLNAFDSDAGYSKQLKGSSVIFANGDLHEHPICGAACNHETNHGDELWQPLKYDAETMTLYCGGEAVKRFDHTVLAGETYIYYMEYQLPAGNYYLAENIALNGGTANGQTYVGGLIYTKGYDLNVNLCLNGFTLSATNPNTPLLSVSRTQTLTLSDCKGGGKVQTDAGGYNVLQVYGDGGYKGTFTMYGGTISGASTGVYAYSYGDVNLFGGTITGNECGLDIGSNSSVTVGGTMNITGNTKQNLNLYTSGKTTAIISIDSTLTQASRIGISSSLTADGTSPIQVATGAENDALKYTEIFTADAKNEGYVVVKNGTELYLKKHTHDWTYTADKETKTITAACTSTDGSCPLNGVGGSVTLKAPEGTLTYTGKDQLASTEGTLSTGETPTIKYMVGGGELAVGSEIRNAGTYTAVLSVGDKLVSVEYTIKPAELTIKANDASTVYGEAAVTNDVTYEGFVEGEDEKVLHGSLTYEFNYTPGSDIGHYSIKPQGLTSNNYAITFKAGTLTVTERTVALNWHDFENRTYNDGKEVTATAGNLVNGDEIKVTVENGDQQAFGTYTATATGLTGDKAKNYALPMNTEREYTIGLAKQTLTFEKSGAQSVTYGDTLTNAATNDCADKNGGAVTYTSSNENVATVDENGIVTGKKVGTVTITATAAAVDGKYAEATASYELTVTQRSISLSLRQITRKYGEPGVDFASALYIVDGSSLAKGDTLAGLKPSWSSAGVGTANVGTYDVNVYTWGNANYSVTFDGAQKLTVIPRPITVEVDAVSRVYGERNPNFIANTVTSGSLVEGDMLVLYLTTTATETSPVGKYDVTLASSDSPNYDVTIIGEKKLTVEPKAITVTVDAVSRFYGDANPNFTVKVPSGALVGEDTIESLGLGLTSTATETSPVGKYDVTGSASNANYAVTIDGAQKLTVNPKPIHVPAAGTNILVYNGKTQTYTPDGLDTTYCEITGNTAKDVYVGGYTAYVSLKDPKNTEWDEGQNETAGKEYQFRITPAPATVTVQDKKITAGQPAPELTNAKPDEDYTIDGVFEGDTLSIKLYYADPSDLSTAVTPDTGKAGTYAIVAAFGGTSNANYDVTFVSGTLTIENRPVFTYPVNLPEKTENGSVSASVKSASAGMTVTITVKPDDGFKLGSLTVTDQNGKELELTDKGGGKYTFTMPAGKVDVSTAFVKTVETSPFTDVKDDAYYYEAVKWAAENGITGGIGGNLFGPEQPCTRAQIVTFLWRAAGSSEPKALSSFTDVVSGSYYEKAVAWATENGITNGTDETHFSPDAACTRAQAVTFLARAAKASAAGSAGFHDVADHAYYAAAVKWAVDNGITNGIGGGLFGPDNDCTRAQIVTFLYRAMK